MATPGDLDPTFGLDGVATLQFSTGGSRIRDLEVASDGKIVVAVTGDFGRKRLLAIRLHGDGSLDAGFGDSGGRVTVPHNDTVAGQNGVAVELRPDGRILVVDDGGSGGTVIVYQLQPDGLPDAAFGTGGQATVIPCVGGGRTVVDALLQPDGHLVVVVRDSSATCPGFLLARFDPAGTLDGTFGVGGVVALDLAPDNEVPWRARLQPDGKIVVAGHSDDGLTLARYMPNGTLDAGFGTGGVVTEAVGDIKSCNPWGCQDVVVQADGAIAAVVRLDTGETIVMRLLNDGTVDGTFGAGGSVEVPGLSHPTDLRLQSDGKLIVIGTLGIARLDAAGTLDPSFGTGGVTAPSPYVGAAVGELAADGRILAATWSGIGERHNDFFRLLGDCGNGALDGAEACDDGNVLPGDCCSSACTFEAAGSPCNGNGDLCTRDECDGSATCVFIEDGPQVTGCRQPLAAGKSLVKVRAGTTPDGNQITWKWAKGAKTAPGDLGMPDTVADQALCIYDESGVTPSVLLRAEIPAGGTCGTKACWRATGFPPGSRGYKYKDPDRTPDGIDRVALKPGPDGKAKIVVKGKGATLALPTLPIAEPLAVRVQLKNGVGQCWEATYSTALRNDAGQLKAKSD
jgi:uncharacterized delta-60 repeat protein